MIVAMRILDGLGSGATRLTSKDSAILVDDQILTSVPSGWTNVNTHTPGNASSYCLEKTSAGAAVSRNYGSVAGYVDAAPYELTWAEKTTGAWAYQREVARSLYYGTGTHVLIKKEWAISADPLFVESFRVRRMINAEFAAESDRVTALAFGSVDAAAYPDLSHLALLPRTMDKLINGGTLKIALVGDSFQNTLSTTPWEALLMRNYPRCTVIPYIFAIGSTGMDWPLVDGHYGWDSPTRLDGVISYAPDLVFLGGISSTFGLSPGLMPVADSKAHWASVVSYLRAGLPNVEIMVGSKANGHDSTDAYMTEVATANSVAFFNESAAINTFCTRAGTTTSTLIAPPEGDGVHFGWKGAAGLCRCWGAFFGACGT